MVQLDGDLDGGHLIEARNGALDGRLDCAPDIALGGAL